MHLIYRLHLYVIQLLYGFPMVLSTFTKNSFGGPLTWLFVFQQALTVLRAYNSYITHVYYSTFQSLSNGDINLNPKNIFWGPWCDFLCQIGQFFRISSGFKIFQQFLEHIIDRLHLLPHPIYYSTFQGLSNGDINFPKKVFFGALDATFYAKSAYFF